jgi:TonB-linked SusC/RagA family outer membrane protein
MMRTPFEVRLWCRTHTTRLLLFLSVFLFSLSLFAQEKTLSGIVLDENKAPVTGAVVTNQRSKQVVHSDDKGHFTIKVLANDKIEISYVGKTTETVTYVNQSTLEVSLKNNKNEALDEVVITGYQTIKKKNFTGAATTLNASDVERAGIPDVTKMLEGQFAGVSMQNVSGTFGAAPKLRIRGATSLSGDNKPLWVIDGIIVEDPVNISNEALSTGDMSTLLGSSVAGLNPDDIADITILRDAAATALYGARAMNGVVVVSTKKGKQTQGQAKISYTGNYSMYIKPNYSQFDILNSGDQMAVLVEMLNKGYYQMPNVINGASGGPIAKMYSELYNYDSVTNTYALKNTASDRNAFLQRYANANTDWFDILFKNSFINEHSVSVTSGTDRTQNYASVSYLKDDGVTIGNNVERITGNYRLNFKMGKKVSVELLSNASVRNQRAPGTRNTEADVVYGSNFRNFDINPYSYASNTTRLLTPYDQNGNLEYFRQNYAPFNIINELNTNYLKLNVQSYKIQGRLDYKLFPGLTYSLTGSYQYTKSEGQVHVLEGSNLVKAYKAAYDPTVISGNQFLYTNPDAPYSYPMVVLPNGGFYNVTTNSSTNTYLRHELNYEKDISDIHHVRLFAAMEARNTKRQYEFFDGVGYQYENGGLVNPYYMYFKQAGEAVKPYFGMSTGIDRYLAYFVQGTYSYKDKYTFTPTLRFDGSNQMGSSKTARWLPTWSVSGNWNINREDFWVENNILSSAILRASYGLVGNINSNANSAATFYNRIARRPFLQDQETQIFISNLENGELTWEKTKDLNLGLELGFLKNNRILFVVDYYSRNIKDLIGAVNTSGIGGQFVKYGNYASMKSNGTEFTLNARIVQEKNFGWTSRFNLALNKNKITDLRRAPQVWNAISANGAAVEGYPQRGLFSIKFAGLNHDYGYPTFIDPADPKITTTQVSFQGTVLDGLVYHGPIDPTTTGGWYNQFRYKNFTLSGLVKFAFGNYVRKSPTIRAVYNDMSSLTKDVLNRWVLPGDEMHTSVPAILDILSLNQVVTNTGTAVDASYAYNAYNYSDVRVAKGDYIKLSNISFGYNLPKSLYEKAGLTNASLSVVANNIVIFYADKKLNGQDPEFISSGGVALPVSRQVTLSLKLGL